ncbi:MAG: bifunctional 4-hydroxy-2-oxoglutarate aldolase/2-dehydro-3-deoxy-phosphogluconate aldolase [Fidelibacterota bacterium]|nr:MAG: bifunctional 4-hydroxy-2-oxoglutarate aldolase/2-dehydro-3-deoxy-phosphogluconate aldolase [Candidatus Neomarinimicrobiota bacterium]
MPDRNAILDRILAKKAVAVIRMADVGQLAKVIEAVYQGGVECIEITMTVPNAVEVIGEVSKVMGDTALIGAGTVLDADTALATIKAGAEFIVSPVFDRDVLDIAHTHDKVVIPGAFSPAEIVSAWNAGADVVKIFPATVLGPRYVKDIRGPLPQIRLCPTGGVTVDNAGEWIAAGAACVGIGTNLLDKKAIAEERFEVLTQRAQRMVASIGAATQ